MKLKLFIFIVITVQIFCSCATIHFFKKLTSVQLTSASKGHHLNSTQCFSPDGKWIVYDSRNYDSMLAASGEIRMINIVTKEDRLLYKTAGQSQYGPGAGAVSFSPVENKILFLSGIKNSNELNPYSITRRTGIAISTDQPLQPEYLDARDIEPPFTAGALRGGTHAHTWSGDGKWVSFTYNDYVLQQAEKKYPEVKDMRTIGVMFPQAVQVQNADGIECFSGNMFSVLLAPVIQKPAMGTDEISKAFDECWIGQKGYRKADGTLQKKAIAFQGLVLDSTGKEKTEIFVADIPEDFTSKLKTEKLKGTDKTLPEVPETITRKRITFTQNGVSPAPRHWLRTSHDGALIGFLAADANNLIQLYGVSPNGGAIRQLSFLSSSIQGPFNFSPDGQHAIFIADGSIYACTVNTGKSVRLTEKADGLTGAPTWSPHGNNICYNKYETDSNGNKFLQIFLLSWQ